MNPGGNHQPQQQFQNNSATSGGRVYAHQGGGPMNIYTQPQQTVINAPRRRGGGWAVLVVLAVDVAFFFYGMLAYTGRNTAADTWRAGIFLVLVAVTGSLVRRWLRRL